VQAPPQFKLCSDRPPGLPAAQCRLCRGDQLDEGPIIAHEGEYSSHLIVLETKPDLCARPTAVPSLGRRPPLLEGGWADAGLAVAVGYVVAGPPVIALPVDVQSFAVVGDS
jgi:hypothetical protein